MKGKCFNYKFLILMFFPLIGIFLAICFLLFTPTVGLWIFLFIVIISLLDIMVLLFLEPLFYIIDQGKIKIICAFKEYCFLYNQVEYIELHYDIVFEYLFIKDYIVVSNVKTKIPKRCERIFKYGKTKELIKKYYGSKIRKTGDG